MNKEHVDALQNYQAGYNQGFQNAINLMGQIEVAEAQKRAASEKAAQEHPSAENVQESTSEGTA